MSFKRCITNLNPFRFKLWLCLFLCITSPALSYYVTLKDNELNPGKGKTLLNMYITNESNSMKAIVLSPKHRSVDSSGIETVSETNELLIFPSQVILPPKSEKAVTIRWAGEKTIRTERSYRVIVDELNVGKKQSDNTKMVRTKVRFIKSVYVAPYTVIKKFEIKAKPDRLPDEEKILRVTIHNTGTVRELFTNAVLECMSFGKIATIKIESQDVEPFKSNQNILAGNHLNGWIPWPKNIDPKTKEFFLVDYNIEEEPEE